MCNRMTGIFPRREICDNCGYSGIHFTDSGWTGKSCLDFSEEYICPECKHKEEKIYRMVYIGSSLNIKNIFTSFIKSLFVKREIF